MPEITVDIPERMPPKIARFELEQQLRKKQEEFERIEEAVEKLDFSGETVEKFDEAREKAWKERKKQLS
ncbi:MAG: hypothetical protein SVS85_02585 [Candidatus Nanohaloarchaea archaeon]|nr:hypothetical protein [Candidatus Nanohaloarchaea archaeon]